MSVRMPPRQVGLSPEDAFNRASALQQRGDLVAAEKVYRAILKQNPKHFQVLSNLATILLAAERIVEAVELLRKALNQNPNSAPAHCALARALQMLDRHEEAMERARRAVALSPGLADAHATLAQGLANLGRYEEAVSAMAQAITLAPDRARFYAYWGHLTRWTADDPRLAALEEMAENSASRPLSDRVELNFALAKAYADCGDVERSFRHQIDGGALQRRIFKYDEAASLGEFEAMGAALDAAWVSQHAGAGDPSPLPVFIVGMPRSGTTLVEQILASHPRVHALGERLTLIEAIAQSCGTRTVTPSLPRIAAQWPNAELRRIGARYVQAATRGVPAHAVRVTDKLPANFQFAGIIHAALPNARIIHTRRDPVDTCLSMFSILFAGYAQLYSYDLGELGRYYAAYQKLMVHWRRVLPAGVMLEVEYEDVVDDLEGQARRIVAHCGLEWDDACLAFHETDRPVQTVSHAQVRQPIYRSSVGRPRPPRELLLPLLDALDDL